MPSSNDGFMVSVLVVGTTAVLWLEGVRWGHCTRCKSRRRAENHRTGWRRGFSAPGASIQKAASLISACRDPPRSS